MPDKIPVMGFLQRGGKLRAMVIKNTKSETLYYAVRNNIKEQSIVMTDGYRGYMGFDRIYNCKSTDHSAGLYGNGETHTNTLEGFWSQFKKGIKGIYHKATPRHLQKYVDEFVFRYNYRSLNAQQQIDCVISKMECRLKYKDLVA